MTMREVRASEHPQVQVPLFNFLLVILGCPQLSSRSPEAVLEDACTLHSHCLSNRLSADPAIPMDPVDSPFDVCWSPLDMTKFHCQSKQNPVKVH